MSKLHELLAVEGDIEGEFKKIVTEAQHTFDKKPNHFFGSIRRLEMFKEEDQSKSGLEEHQEMVTTVYEKLKYTSSSIERYFDALLQKERTNQDAKADLVVNGVLLAKDVPATFLLGLESRLKIVRSVYQAIPTLPPGYKWERDEAQGKGVYRQSHPEEKFKTAKTFKHKILYEATDKHPAQIEKWEENENVGKYITEKWCGMISSAEKSVLLNRIDKLIRATKKARQRANTAAVVKLKIGDDIIKYIHGE
jgi:hypothetical protein